jgi:small ligand-binding sensory domain FIST
VESNNDNDTQRTSQWESIVSTQPNITEAVEELIKKSCALEEEPPDLAFLFVSQYHASNFPIIVPRVYSFLNKDIHDKSRRRCRLLSVVGSGVIGEDQEWDEPSKPALSLMVGRHLPNLESMQLFDFNELHKPPPPSTSEYWTRFTQNSSRNQKNDDDGVLKSSAVLILADPWSPVEKLTSSLPVEAVVAGGISCPTGTGPTVALDNECLQQGSLVGVCLPKGLNLQIVTAQGCRPVENDRVRTVTAAEGSVILALDGQPALSVLEDIVQSSTKPLTGIVCGIQTQEPNEEGDVESNRPSVESNDYLIRQIVGFVPTRKGIAVPGAIHVGDRFRFFVRDKEAARQDLSLMLQRARTERTVYGQGLQPKSWVAAWQFSCVARGRRFFGATNVDLEQTKALLARNTTTMNNEKNKNPPAVAGFFANGELGPVGIAGTPSGGGLYIHRSHIHGFTTVVAYLCDTTGVSTKQEHVEPVLSPVADDPSAWG